jgi:hypothetical protein
MSAGIHPVRSRGHDFLNRKGGTTTGTGNQRTFAVVANARVPGYLQGCSGGHPVPLVLGHLQLRQPHAASYGQRSRNPQTSELKLARTEARAKPNRTESEGHQRQGKQRVEEVAGAVGSGASEETEGDEYQRVREGSDGDREGTMGRTPSSLEGP